MSSSSAAFPAEVNHVVWGSHIERECGGSSSTNNEHNDGRYMDGVEIRPESSSLSELDSSSATASRQSRSQGSPQNMARTMPISRGADPVDIGAQRSAAQCGGSVGSSTAGGIDSAGAMRADEEVDDLGCDTGWVRWSQDEQADVCGILMQTEQAGVLPEGLQDFWGRGCKAHIQGLCRPCHYIHTSTGCKNGQKCRYCHIPHAMKRPSQMQRKLCKRFVAALSELRLVEEEASKALIEHVAQKNSYFGTLLRGDALAKRDTAAPSRDKQKPGSDRMRQARLNFAHNFFAAIDDPGPSTNGKKIVSL
mmetsp:Transcript_62524/g.162229  ORF Transcript_62524/g.162229 Transcript_62524/m.162229 type:complete len:307 (-) Transcript_62524:282-1202(-)